MQQQQRKAVTTSTGGVASAATTAKRTRTRNNSNMRQQMHQQQQPQNPIATSITITPTKQKTFTTFKFNNSVIDGRVTESTTANVNFQQRSRKQEQQVLDLVDSDDVNYEDDYTSSSSTFSSSSHQHSLDYEAEDEYEDKKKTYENKSLIHVQNFLKCFDGPIKKPAATRNVTAVTTTTSLQTSSALTTVSYINSALTAASAAEAELINSLTTFKSGLNASNYVSSDVTSNSCINTVLPFTSSNSSLPSCISYVSSTSALDDVNSVTSLNTNSNIIPVNSINVTDLTDNQNSIATKFKSTNTSLELRNFRSNYKNTPSTTTITATSTSTTSTTSKLQKFQISTKFLRKPRTKLKMLPTVGQRHDELPTSLQLEQTEQEKEEQQMMAGLAPQLFTDDSNAKFKDFSIDSLLNK